jgi:ubiquitin-activating enzyme E1
VCAETVSRYARLFMTELTGLCAFLGGAAAQEVLKAAGKYTPVNHWVHHAEGALVADACPSNVGPLLGSRHDHQVTVMGKDFEARMAEQRVFLVGYGRSG